MSKPWGGIGAWAADAERAEAEEREAQAAAPSKNFPSLKEAANTKPKKKKMTLSEFTMGTLTGPGAGSRKTDNQGLTPEEMSRLPTGPKDRSGEEIRPGRLGGGFPTYDRHSMPAGRSRDRDEGDGSWGAGAGGRRSYGGFDEERRGSSPMASNFDQPSRADEVDNWAMTKKSPALDSGRQNRYGSLGGGMGGSESRADEVDNWASTKKPIPSRSSTFGSGYREREANEPDRWARGRSRDSDTERPRLVLDPPKGNVVKNEATRTNKPSPFGAARPREEVLAEKGFDWKKLDTEIEAKRTSRPSSAHSSRPSSAQSSRSEGLGLHGVDNVVKPKVNPFGDAKPREVLLEERGKDWRKIDLQLQHRAVDRPETEEERMLKEEIDLLRKELEKGLSLNTNKESVQESTGEIQSLRDRVNKKERELETLVLDLDDKVRFGKKAIERPGSGAGRAAAFSERPPSQGSFDESRSYESMDRPRSRGTADVWSRSADDRKPVQGARDRGFLGNRDMERSRDRW